MEETFPPLLNDAILKVANGETPHRIPVWMMRQAGRYLPEFLEVRKHHGFFDIVNTPELAAKITLQPIERFDLDASIIFSDILVIPQAVGMEVKMEPGVGPVLPAPLSSPDDMKRLHFDADVTEKMKGTLDAITLTRKLLKGRVPLIGFSGAPWTLMSYMIEGGGSKTLTKSKAWLYKYPDQSKNLINRIGDIVIRYLVEQVKSGAQLLQVFESHADLLSPYLFREFCIPVLTRIRSEVVDSVRALGLQPVPMIIFAKGAHYALEDISKLGYNIIGLDWTVNAKASRVLLGNKAVQGNMDPVALFGTTEAIKREVHEMVTGFGTTNYVCNLGHGIYPETPVENVQTFIETVHSYKIQL